MVMSPNFTILDFLDDITLLFLQVLLAVAVVQA